MTGPTAQRGRLWVRARAHPRRSLLDPSCCALARIAWGLFPESTCARLAALDPEVADKELAGLADVLEDTRARGK